MVHGSQWDSGSGWKWKWLSVGNQNLDPWVSGEWCHMGVMTHGLMGTQETRECVETSDFRDIVRCRDTRWTWAGEWIYLRPSFEVS